MNDSITELLRDYFDGDLPVTREQELFRHLSHDENSRDLFRFEYQLRNTLPNATTDAAASIPSGFSDRVMGAIDAKENKSKTAPSLISDLAGKLWSLIREPHVVMWQPAYTGALVVVLAIAVTFVTETTGPYLAESSEKVSLAFPDTSGEDIVVRFIFLSEDVSSVAVAGDFNMWEHVPLHREVVEGGAVWTAMLAVPRGEHRYMFVLDGQEWVTDPLAPVHREDGFGNNNAVLVL